MTQNARTLRTAALAAAGTALLLGVGIAVANMSTDESEEEAARTASPAVSAAPARTPERRVIEDCNQYAAAADRNEGRILRDGAIGGAVGAGVGAAGGAIADGGEGAGKGAGIGAIVGAVGGTLYGLNEENNKTEAARAAYQQCMARRGY